MAKKLSYADALKILGKNDSEVLDLAEKLADGGLGALGVPDLFGIRSAVVGRGRKALEGMRGKLRGESRMSRTEKILAAERILVVVSFFEAVEEAWERTGMPFPFSDLEITAEEQLGMSDALTEDAWVVLPTLIERWSPNTRRLSAGQIEQEEHENRFSELNSSFMRMIPGLAVAEENGISGTNDPRLVALDAHIDRICELRYSERRRALAAEIPEFALWTREQEHELTRRRLDTGLAEVGRRLERIACQRPLNRRRQELARIYRAALRQPLLPSGDTNRDLVLPSLQEAYIPPGGRITWPEAGPISSESWWQRVEPTDDLEGFIAAHLAHPDATDYPTVLLGHPGAGKSKFTEMLAAQLPPSDFLPLRVELRSLPPNAPIHVQIEQGLAQILNTRVSWRELVDSADGTLPVIILDGFDELLQATGVDRSDYLERVQEFQQQQEAMGLPVVVIVTTRTVVADRARFPDGTTVIRLEPFDEPRIDRFLQAWNRADSGLRPSKGSERINLKALLRYRELAVHPLLLVMLLIYDAEDGALRRAEQHLTHGELYERLLTRFAAREVSKHGAALNRDGFDRAVQDELRRLEVAALAMFNRRRQHVTADELDRDLAALMPGGPPEAADPDLHGRIAPAHRLLGRFFFVHEARAQARDGTSSVFEFLHATFGEYLVSRAVVSALDYLNEARALARKRRGSAQGADDGELYALLSFACLTGREKITDFLAEELGRRFPPGTQARAMCSALLVDLFQEAPFPDPGRSHGGYAPARLPVTRRQGNYTANLIVLLTLVGDRPVDLRELFPDAPNPLPEWRNMAGIWRALHSSEWFGFLNAVRVRHLGGWDREDRRSLVSRDRGEPVNAGECIGFELYTDVDVRPDVLDPYEVRLPFASTSSRMLRSTAMRVNGTNARTVLGLLPYLYRISDDLGSWYTDRDSDKAWLEAHELLRLRLEPPDLAPGRRLDGYRRLLSSSTLGPLEFLVLRQAAEDLRWSDDAAVEDREPLCAVIRHYLDRVRTVAPGAASSARAVHAVLTSLLEDFPAYQRSKNPGEAVTRVRALVDRAFSPSFSDKRTPPPTHPDRTGIILGPAGSGEH
ncbi:NACHT domain-containing protein [Nocardiopsis flavescens]|uniref:NACHT domain-containing protein n=1 Tax=Nocardiopsis flavescens TaxID=758803 RepID=A0A1M6H9K0_9ACTN|nr:NACHT domain-containing protein [Nocardiopsis flavescens]SHJ18891.1 NACHT domain-containing protein [Nocardiopsis flavescens]